MKKNKIIFLAIGLIFVLYLTNLFVGVIGSFFKSDFVEEPSDYKEILDDDDLNLTYEYTLTKDSIYPVSVYTYDKKYGIIVFKRRLKVKDIINNITLHDKMQSKNTNRVYTNFLSLEQLNYSYENIDSVSKLSISINGYKEDYIKDKTSKKMYLSFPLSNTFGMTYNGSGRADLQAHRVNYKNLEYNELFLFEKKGYVYFVYLKPFSEYPQERFILKSLIKWNNLDNEGNRGNGSN